MLFGKDKKKPYNRGVYFVIANCNYQNGLFSVESQFIFLFLSAYAIIYFVYYFIRNLLILYYVIVMIFVDGKKKNVTNQKRKKKY